MNRVYRTYNQVIVFSKWTDKGYAVFSGLKKVIKIAKLKIDLCDYALQKLKKRLTEFLFYKTLCEQQEKSEVDLFLEEELLNFVNISLASSDYNSCKIDLFNYKPKSMLINFNCIDFFYVP